MSRRYCEKTSCATLSRLEAPVLPVLFTILLATSTADARDGITPTSRVTNPEDVTGIKHPPRRRSSMPACSKGAHQAP